MFKQLLVLVFCVGLVDACRPGVTCQVWSPLDEKNINFAKEYNLSTNLSKVPKPRVIPESVTLDAATIKHLNNDCRAGEGALAFQSGYARACDWLLSEIGIRENRFQRGPSMGQETIYPNKSVSVVVPIQPGNFMRFNLSAYTFDVLRGDGVSRDSGCLLNYSDSYKYALYNITYYDRENYNYHLKVDALWGDIAYYRGTWENVTYVKTKDKGGIDNNDYYLRVYFR